MEFTGYNDELASNRTETINKRYSERNIPSQNLQPYYYSRPVSTKYTIMPIVDSRKKYTTSSNTYPNYNIENTFNPGTDKSPWSGFASNINKESELRNQLYAKSNCSQSVYIPSSKSDLYQLHWKEKKTIQQPFNNLFSNETYDKFNPNPDSNIIGFALFNNATRQQIKELDVKKFT